MRNIDQAWILYNLRIVNYIDCRYIVSSGCFTFDNFDEE